MAEDEKTQVIKTLGQVDTSIAHHTAELARCWELRVTLAERLEQLGLPVPPAPQEAPEAITEPATVRVEPTEQEWPLRPVGNFDPRQTRPRSAPVVEVAPLAATVKPDGYRYERVLIKATDVPISHQVQVFDDQIAQEAHLASRTGSGRAEVRALCGRQASPTEWWVPRLNEMDVRVELCGLCARFIPGVVRTG